MTKRPEEIALLAESGKLLASVFSYLDRLSLAGMSTMQVNDMVDRFIVNDLQTRPASKGQYGYAYALNSSRNHVVCHGAQLGDVGHAIERHARRNGYSVVREYCGHGIGREMHEPPEVLPWGKPQTGQVLREGMVFTIEPMINQGRMEDDGWTVVTRDRKLSAQFEHTVAVTRTGVQVLTLRAGERENSGRSCPLPRPAATRREAARSRRE